MNIAQSCISQKKGESSSAFLFTKNTVLWYTIARESRRGALSRVRQESGTVELEQAKKRVEELRAVIEKNNRLYYDQDAPELEDFE